VIDERDILEKSFRRYEPEGGSFERLVRRRDRRRRNQRIAAGVLGIAIAIGVALLGVSMIRSTSPVPGDESRPPTPSPEEERDPGRFDWESVPGVSIDGDAIVDIRTGEVTPLPASIASFPDATGYAVAPGGEVLLFEDHVRGGSGDQIFVANVDGTDLRQLTDAPGGGAFAGGWSADGSTIVAVLDAAAGFGDVDLVLIDVATGETTQLARGPAGDFHQPHFSPDGQLVLFSRFQKYRDLEAPYPQDEGSDVYGIPVAGGDAALVFEDRWNATFSPDGRTIVYERMVAVGNMGGMEVWLADADGSHRRPLVPNDGPFSDTPSWSPDGTRIVFTRHTGAFTKQPGDGNLVAVVDVATGTPTFSVRAPGSLAGVWLDDDTLLVDVDT
jgi:hypothetical protein